MFEVILAAGGKSSRLGRPKGLYPVNGSYWIDHQLKKLRLAGVSRVLLILGYDSDAYFKTVPEILDTHFCKTLINTQPEHGPFSSLQTGLRELQKQTTPTKAVFFLPIDTPAPSPEVFEALARGIQIGTGNEKSVALPAVGRRSGHPVLLSWSFCEKLLAVDCSHPIGRLDKQIKALLPKYIQRVETEDRNVLLNFNAPEDFASYESGAHGL